MILFVSYRMAVEKKAGAAEEAEVEGLGGGRGGVYGGCDFRGSCLVRLTGAWNTSHTLSGGKVAARECCDK